jgi:hypothetical protein
MMPMRPADVLAPALRRARGPVLGRPWRMPSACCWAARMVHAGNAFALGQRDSLVNAALAHDSATLSLRHGQPIRAALRDFTANLTLGAVPPP